MIMEVKVLENVKYLQNGQVEKVWEFSDLTVFVNLENLSLPTYLSFSQNF